MDLTFEYEAPQFIESWEKATNFHDGADHFFDALDYVESDNTHQKRRESFFGGTIQNELATADSTTLDSEIQASEIGNDPKTDVENMCAQPNEDDSKSRRLSLKRKASPLKDRNYIVPSSFNNQHRHRKITKKPAIQLLPTIAESPVLLTKSRVRPKTVPESEEDKRLILKPLRKQKIGVCIKPLPKPPTIPEPFNLTENGKHAHSCYGDSPRKDTSCITSVTPGKELIKKKRLESTNSEATPRKPCPFSFYERDQEIMKRKLERMNAKSQGNEEKFEFRAKSPTVLKKDPFRPEVPGRIIEAISPEFSTEERAKKREISKNHQMCFGEKKLEELENNLFVFKAQPGPKGNSSFLSSASSSKRDFFNSSVASSIRTNTSEMSMPFSFYEKDLELLRKKEERLKQVEVTQWEFKAKEPKVLSKDPFWPMRESRLIPVGTGPSLSTEERAEQWRKIELRKQEEAERQKALKEELKKAEEEEIRMLRKSLLFKATRVKK